MAVFASLQGLSALEYKLEEKKLMARLAQDATLDQAEELKRLDDLKNSNKAQIRSAIKGMSAGAAYFGFGNSLEYLIEEGANHVDWSAISANIGKTTNNIGQAKDGLLSQVSENASKTAANAAGIAPKVDFDPQKAVMGLAGIQQTPSLNEHLTNNHYDLTPQGVAPINIEDQAAGFQSQEVITKAFGNPDVLDAVTHKQVSSMVGLAQANIAEFDYGIKNFNPNDVDQLRQFQAESQADLDYQNKIHAFINKFISLNQDKMDAFTDEKTGVVGETFSYAYDDNTPIEFHTLQDLTQYFHSGQYTHDINGDAHVTIENEGFKPSTYTFKGEDPVFKDLSKEVLGIQDIDLEPGQVSSIHGLAQAEYAKDYLGIKDFDPINNDEHIQKFWQATSIDSPDRDPLYELRVNKIAEKFTADNPYAVLRDTQGNPTDLFRRINLAHEPATLKMLANSHDLAAGLVNEGPVKVDMGPDSPWTYLTLDHDTNVRELAEQIFYRADFGFADFDPSNPDHLDKIRQLIQEKYGDNPSLVELKLKAIIQYLRDNEPEGYFNGDTILAKSALGSNRANLIKVLRDFEPVLEAAK